MEQTQVFRGLGKALDEGFGEDREDARSPKVQMALALGRVKSEDQVYSGTVSHAEVQRRRRRNRVARASRRINRSR